MKKLIMSLTMLLVLFRIYAAYGQDATSEDSTTKLKQIGLSALNFESAIGNMPARYSASPDRKLLSWRVHLLQFLGGDSLELYKKFRLDEPWNSPHNRELITEMPEIYADSSVLDPGHTVYLAVDDKAAALGPPVMAAYGTQLNPKGYGLKCFESGTTNTILVVKADPKSAVPWTQPTDLQLPDNVPDSKGGEDVSIRRLVKGLFDDPDTSRMVALADGSVRSVLKADFEEKNGILTAFVKPLKVTQFVQVAVNGPMFRKWQGQRTAVPVPTYPQAPSSSAESFLPPRAMTTRSGDFGAPPEMPVSAVTRWQSPAVPPGGGTSIALLRSEALNAKDEKTREAKLKDLQTVLEKSFDNHLNRQKEQLSMLQTQVAEIESTLEHRFRNRERLIKNFVDQVRLQAEGLTIPVVDGVGITPPVPANPWAPTVPRIPPQSQPRRRW